MRYSRCQFSHAHRLTVLCRDKSQNARLLKFYFPFSSFSIFSPELTTLALTGKSYGDFFAAGVKQGRDLRDRSPRRNV
ncbi:protein of unknown function [Enterobacter cancerogenus]|nr:protein of unknown function [Enterobacter cancerogenus]